MAETIELLSKAREAQLRAAAEARELQQVQERWKALADEYHGEIRRALDEVGRKAAAIDLGVDQSTISNWTACEHGRGFPPPRLLLYLREKSTTLAAWENTHAGFLAPERPHKLTAEERLRRIEQSLATSPDIERLVLDRAFGPGVRP